MQLLCSGSYLDLPANQQLQFKDDNPLFAFDKIACERTTEFSLPCTPTNDKVFGLARIPAYTGAGMRQKFAAQLIEGQVIKQGYLYVTAFDGKQYKCTFVTGELLGLQAVKNAGKVADVLRANIAAYTNNHSALYEYGGQTRPVRDDNREVDEVAYRKQSGLCLPSVDIYWMINSALTELGVPHSIDMHNFRIIPLQLKAFNSTDSQLIRTTTAMSLPTGILADYFSIVQSSFLYYTYRCYEDHDDPSIIHKIPTQETISCNALQCSVDITLVFPLDAVDLVVVVPDGTLEPQQISDRHFNLDTAILEGTPVAGGSVDIPKNTPFFICKSGDYVKDMDKQPLPYPQEWQEEWGWNIRNNSITQTAAAESAGDVVAGDKIVIADNLPDISVIELCKIYAALTGTALNYDEQQGLTFDEIDIDDWEVKDLSKLIKRGEVKRTFSDYAQTNKIVFESGSGVMNAEKVSQSYLVPNDNIDSEKELQKIPFSEGGAIGTDVYVRDNEDKEVIAAGYAGEQMPYMPHISLPKNEGLQSLCDASTQIIIESRMSLLEYNSIKPNTLLQVEGGQYVWNSRNWQKNNANMVLAKTGKIIAAIPTPKSNEIWIYPESTLGDFVTGASVVGTRDVRGITANIYSSDVVTLKSVIGYSPNNASIVIFPEGFTSFWYRGSNYSAYIEHLFLPSTFQHTMNSDFSAQSTGFTHHIWLAWTTPQTFQGIGNYDRVKAFHIRAGLKAAYIAEGWPEARLVEDYTFDPWSLITRGGILGGETPNER